MAILKGRVLWAGTSARVPDAYIDIRGKDGGEKKPVLLSDEDGDFEIELADGEWEVTVLHPDGRSGPAKAVNVPNDLGQAGDGRIEFPIVSLTNSLSQRWGMAFFIGLIVGLAAVTGVWVWAHTAYPDPRPPTIASTVLNLAAEAQVRLAESEDPIGDASLASVLSDIEQRLEPSGTNGKLERALHPLHDLGQTLEKLVMTVPERALRTLNDLESDLKLKGAGKTDVLKQLQAAKETLRDATKPNKSAPLQMLIEALKTNSSINGSLKPKYLEQLGAIKDEIDGSNADEDKAVQKRKNDLSNLLKELTDQLPTLAQAEVRAADAGSSIWIWSTSPKIYLEILFWALAGTLVRLIFVVHRYLRWNRFVKQGIYQHVAFLITVPILTLVFVAVISMAKLTAEDSSVVLDFSDPRIIAGGSFLIALVPWQLWERLLGTASGIVGRRGQEHD